VLVASRCRRCDLNFADDIALTADSWSSVQLSTKGLQEETSKVGLYINPDKRNVMDRAKLEYESSITPPRFIRVR